MDILLYELKKLGLKEKEAKVYLAGLELGLTTIKQLAERTGITRPTAYEIVSSLKKRGLFTESKEAKKRRVFAAQSPEMLLGILRSEQKVLAEREREFLRIIAALESRYALQPGGGIIAYRGAEGIRALEEKITTAPGKIIRVIANETVAALSKRKKWYEEINKRMGMITVREFSSLYRNNYKSKGIEWSSKKNPFPDSPTLLIFEDRSIVITGEKDTSYLVENPVLVGLFSAFFDMLWGVG